MMNDINTKVFVFYTHFNSLAWKQINLKKIYNREYKSAILITPDRALDHATWSNEIKYVIEFLHFPTALSLTVSPCYYCFVLFISHSNSPRKYKVTNGQLDAYLPRSSANYNKKRTRASLNPRRGGFVLRNRKKLHWATEKIVLFWFYILNNSDYILPL